MKEKKYKNQNSEIVDEMNETMELGESRRGTVSQTFAVDAEEETGSRVYWFRSAKNIYERFSKWA